MSLQSFFFSLALLLSSPALLADSTIQTNELIESTTSVSEPTETSVQTNELIESTEKTIDNLQHEIATLSNHQEELKDQKNTVLSELRNTTAQLEQAREQQGILTTDIQSLTHTTKKLSGENRQLTDDNRNKEKKIAQLIAENDRVKKQLEEKVIALQADVAHIQSQEQETTRSKLEAETKSALEIHKLQRSIITLQEKIDDCSISNATKKHKNKLILAFALGSVGTYALLKYNEFDFSPAE